MAKDNLSGKLAVILHADIAESTMLVQQDERLAHERIQDAFRRFSETIEKYQGQVRELRGDALLADFERPSDAVTAALAFQAEHTSYIEQLIDDIRPTVRVGIAMGEVIIADNTVTGSGVVLAQRVEQLSEPGGVCITAAIHEGLPKRLPFDQADMGERQVKGFDEPVRVYRVKLKPGQALPQPEPTGHSESSQLKRNSIIALVTVALVVVVGSILWLQPWAPEEEPASIARMAFPLPDKPSIAVLAFDNLSADSEQEYFSDGISEDIITDLSKIANLHVVARNSSFVFKNTNVNIKQVATELEVRYVLEGSVRKFGDRVRITAQLIDSRSGGHVWAERYDRVLENIFDLQDEIAGQIVDALRVKISSSEERAIEERPTNNVDAYEKYLRARSLLQEMTRENVERAADLFESAIALDPNYVQAMAGLADCGSTLEYHYGVSDKTREKTIAYSKRARELNPNLAETHASYGRVLFFLGKEEEAIREFETALELSPNSLEGNFYFGVLYLTSGKAEKALPLMRKAFALAPYDLQVGMMLLLGYSSASRESEARDTANRVLKIAKFRNELHPDDVTATYVGAMAYYYLDKIKEAKSWAELALDLATEDNRQIYNLACLFSLLGEIDRAIDLVARMLRLGCSDSKIKWIRYVDNDLKNIRDRERFQKLFN